MPNTRAKPIKFYSLLTLFEKVKSNDISLAVYELIDDA